MLLQVASHCFLAGIHAIRPIRLVAMQLLLLLSCQQLSCTAPYPSLTWVPSHTCCQTVAVQLHDYGKLAVLDAEAFVDADLYTQRRK
jgi:hypothetical protein